MNGGSVGEAMDKSTFLNTCPSQGLDTVHKQRVAEVLSEPEAREKQRSRESLTSDTVKYESGPDGGEEVSMSVEWNGVSTVQSPRRANVDLCLLSVMPSNAIAVFLWSLRSFLLQN